MKEWLREGEMWKCGKSPKPPEGGSASCRLIVYSNQESAVLEL
jgi:hypothetical protein